MNAARCDHQAGINGATDNTSKWIPCSFIEPIQKLIKSSFNHIGRGTIIKPNVCRGISECVWMIEWLAQQKPWLCVECDNEYLTMGQIHGWYFQIEWQQIIVMQIPISMPTWERQKWLNYSSRLPSGWLLCFLRFSWSINKISNLLRRKTKRSELESFHPIIQLSHIHTHTTIEYKWNTNIVHFFFS